MTSPTSPRRGAKAQLLTILGEFVLPAGGSVWTTSLVESARALGVGEKNARQAISRIADQGLIESRRRGRAVRWSLTARGSALLESGTSRIYALGSAPVEWEGEWLLAHCPIAESHRTVRHRLRRSLAFLGFGELSPSLLVSPHVDREEELRRVVHELDVVDETLILRSRTDSDAANHDIVSRAWDLDGLGRAYAAFAERYDRRCPVEPRDVFVALVDLVDDWRRFPFTDPELPTELLPDRWSGQEAASTFRRRHREWRGVAGTWFGALDVDGQIAG